MELPGIYDAADIASEQGQKTYLRLSATRLIALLVAASCGAIALAVPEISIIGVAVLISFTIAGIAETILLARQPERDWYAGRAIAESTKTLAWRYAVGGDPFPLSLSDEEAEGLLRQRIVQVIDKGKDRLDLSSKPLMVTQAMKQLRSTSFGIRRETYLEERTREQREWYSMKAKYNAKRAKHGRHGLIIGEFGAVVLAALALSTDISIDFAGIIAALIACGAAWLAIKQHSQLTSAYRVAAVELSIQESILSSAVEDDWAKAVGDAEEAISREHTMWLASRGSE